MEVFHLDHDLFRIHVCDNKEDKPEWKSSTMTMFSIHVCDNEEDRPEWKSFTLTMTMFSIHVCDNARMEVFHHDHVQYTCV